MEKVPLCYMTEFAWASTETRKIVKLEERVVHFLDDKQTVRQTEWEHLYAPGCAACSLRPICGGLFDRGEAYDPAELAPVFVDMEGVVRRILEDPSDPSRRWSSLAAWRRDFAAARAGGDVGASGGVAGDDGSSEFRRDVLRDMQIGAVSVPVGRVTARGRRLYEARRRSEGEKAEALGVQMERGAAASGDGEATGEG